MTGDPLSGFPVPKGPYGGLVVGISSVRKWEWRRKGGKDEDKVSSNRLIRHHSVGNVKAPISLMGFVF